ncbi:hypothetical protein C1645_877094 [Glomus cerebriforme]|uniref:Uncharacterized protein n=1 Tax=Glomus cerebriforme TaxID=658196 RepID=A0A397SW47_9GLOM|nr:hypothetical protein C1645_877094 [Glomus cerebriforme]
MNERRKQQWLFPFLEIKKWYLSFQSNTEKFFELFGLEWEGKMVLCAFSLILESEMVLQALQSRLERENVSLCFQFDTGIRNVLLAFGLVREIGERLSFSSGT